MPFLDMRKSQIVLPLVFTCIVVTWFQWLNGYGGAPFQLHNGSKSMVPNSSDGWVSNLIYQMKHLQTSCIFESTKPIIKVPDESNATALKYTIKAQMYLEFLENIIDQEGQSKTSTHETQFSPLHCVDTLANKGEMPSFGEEIPPRHAKKIIIISTWRSGSTFLGDLLNHYPGTWYSFEPLTGWEQFKLGPNSTANEFGVKLISDILNCQPMEDYCKKLKKHDFDNFNHRFWNACKSMFKVQVDEDKDRDSWTRSRLRCIEPPLLEKSCLLFPIRLIKSVRMRMRQVKRLFDVQEMGDGPKICELKTCDIKIALTVSGQTCNCEHFYQVCHVKNWNFSPCSLP